MTPIESIGNFLGFGNSDCDTAQLVAVDDIRYSTYDILTLKTTAENVIPQLYNQLILHWLFSTGTLTNSDWGPDATVLDTMPYHKAFTSYTFRTEYMLNGLQATPDNMILVNYDYLFTKECLRIYMKIRESESAMWNAFIRDVASVALLQGNSVIRSLKENTHELDLIFLDAIWSYPGTVPKGATSKDKTGLMRLTDAISERYSSTLSPEEKLDILKHIYVI